MPSSRDTTVPGLQEARERLEYLRMSPKDRRAYDYYVETLARDTDVERTKLLEAKIEGEKQGWAKGLAEGELNERLKNAKSLKENGVAIDIIAKSIGLSAEEIEEL